jgi:hypothetical protein
LVLRIRLICFGLLLFCDVLNIVNVYIIVKLYISKGKSEAVNLRRTDNALDKSKTTKIQTIHRK